MKTKQETKAQGGKEINTRQRKERQEEEPKDRIRREDGRTDRQQSYI